MKGGVVMNKLSGFLIYKGTQLEKQNMAWNMLGSFCYAFASMVLSFLVMRISGDEAGGVFAIGYSAFGQQMFTLAYFGLRPFQITDRGAGQDGYSFGEYRRHRQITTGMAVIVAALFSAWMGGSGAYGIEKALAVFLLALYKIIDGYADVYESEFQRQGSLYLTGKSNTFRTLLSVAAFLIMLAVTKNLVLACAAAVAAQVLGVALFDCSVIGALPRVDDSCREKSMSKLFLQAGLLFLSVFLDFYIFSAAKYAIDSQLNDAASGYFNLIFMPTSVIYLVANFVIRPFLIRMTMCWNQGDKKGLIRILRKIGGIIAGLTVLAVLGCLALGRFVLSVMEYLLGTGCDGRLTRYLVPFTVIVAGGGIYAMANLMYYCLVIMRRQRGIFLVYAITALGALMLAPALVSRFEIFGAALAYCVFMAMLLLGFGLQTAWMLRKG